jgi:hypothetical protein
MDLVSNQHPNVESGVPFIRRTLSLEVPCSLQVGPRTLVTREVICLSLHAGPRTPSLCSSASDVKP